MAWPGHRPALSAGVPSTSSRTAVTVPLMTWLLPATPGSNHECSVANLTTRVLSLQPFGRAGQRLRYQHLLTISDLLAAYDGYVVTVTRVTPAEAEEIALRYYGVNGTAERLAAEHDDTFRL